MSFNLLEWVFATNARHKQQRHSCLTLKEELDGFFSDRLLGFANFVIVDELPLPPADYIQKLGLKALLSPSAIGLTLANTYYIKPEAAQRMRVHVHELVHVQQWRSLGAARFVKRYLGEVRRHGYHLAPLEQMACRHERLYSLSPQRPFDVETGVRRQLEEPLQQAFRSIS